MENQKIENLLNLALDATTEEILQSENLRTGYLPLENRWEVILRYTGELNRIRQTAENVTELFGGFAVLEASAEQIQQLSQLPEVSFIEKPKRMYFALQQAKNAACITPVQRAPYHLSGAGVIFALIDSGVDIYHPDFRKEDGSSRILALWDQTIWGNPPEGYHRGSVYTREELNEILRQNNREGAEIPGRDLSGHGTAVLGIGAGNGRGSSGRYRGVAYEADIIVVKLGNPESGDFPRTTQVMEAVDYCVRTAADLGQPMSLNLSFGNNYGSHDGRSLLEIYLDVAAQIGKVTISVGMGNEGISGAHASLVLQQGREEIIEFAVGEFQFSTNLQIWKSYSDTIDMILEAPSGARTGIIGRGNGTLRFSLDGTQILVYEGEPSPYGVQQEIYLDLLPEETYVTSGIWRLIFLPIEVTWNLVEMWFPVSETRNQQTRFLVPAPAGSFTVPATADNVISVAAYDSNSNSYAEFSGRAFRVLPWNGKPDLAAPGVDIFTTAVGGGYGLVSGTSFATPFVSGSAALLMEWGIIQGRDPFLYGNKIKAYLRKGAAALPGYGEIPNYEIGFGALCLEGSIP